MLVVIPQSVHVFVPPLAVTNPTRERPKPALCFTFHFAQFALADHIVLISRGFPSGALAGKECLHLLEVFRRRKVATAMRHVILQAVGLLVTLVAIGFRATERLR